MIAWSKYLARTMPVECVWSYTHTHTHTHTLSGDENGLYYML